MTVREQGSYVDSAKGTPPPNGGAGDPWRPENRWFVLLEAGFAGTFRNWLK